MLEPTMEDYVSLFQEQDREAFVERLGVAVLVAAMQQQDGSFQATTTSIIQAPDLAALQETLRQETQNLMRRRVLEIRATDPQGPVTLGRSEENDLVVLHHTVSSRHALFEFGEKRGVQVRDMGSRNGTRLNGDSLDSGERSLLEDKDELQFGEARYTFFSPGGFWDELAWIMKRVQAEIDALANG